MTLNGYFMSNSVFVAAVLLRAFDFKAHHKKTNKGRVVDARNSDENEGE